MAPSGGKNLPGSDSMGCFHRREGLRWSCVEGAARGRQDARASSQAIECPKRARLIRKLPGSGLHVVSSPRGRELVPDCAEPFMKSVDKLAPKSASGVAGPFAGLLAG